MWKQISNPVVKKCSNYIKQELKIKTYLMFWGLWVKKTKNYIRLQTYEKSVFHCS